MTSNQNLPATDLSAQQTTSNAQDALEQQNVLEQQDATDTQDATENQDVSDSQGVADGQSVSDIQAVSDVQEISDVQGSADVHSPDDVSGSNNTQDATDDQDTDDDHDAADDQGTDNEDADNEDDAVDDHDADDSHDVADDQGVDDDRLAFARKVLELALKKTADKTLWDTAKELPEAVLVRRAELVFKFFSVSYKRKGHYELFRLRYLKRMSMKEIQEKMEYCDMKFLQRFVGYIREPTLQAYLAGRYTEPSGDRMTRQNVVGMHIIELRPHIWTYRRLIRNGIATIDAMIEAVEQDELKDKPGIGPSTCDEARKVLANRRLIRPTLAELLSQISASDCLCVDLFGLHEELREGFPAQVLKPFSKVAPSELVLPLYLKQTLSKRDWEVLSQNYRLVNGHGDFVKYQMPSDLWKSDFYAKRREKCKAALEAIDREGLLRAIENPTPILEEAVWELVRLIDDLRSDLRKSRIEEIEAQNQQLTKHVQQLRSDYASLTADYKSATGELATAKDRCRELEERYRAVTDRCRKLEEQSRESAARCRKLEEQNKRQNRELAILRERCRKLEKQNDDLGAELWYYKQQNGTTEETTDGFFGGLLNWLRKF